MVCAGCSIPSVSLSPSSCRESLEARRNSVAAMAYSPDGRILATTHYPLEPNGTRIQVLGQPPGFVWIWHVGELAPVEMFPVAGLSLHSIQFSSDGKRLLVPGANGITVRDTSSDAVWDPYTWGIARNEQKDPDAVETKRESHPVQIEMEPPDAISPNGTIVATRFEYGDTISLVNIQTRAVVRTLRTAGEPQCAEAFSPDGTMLASVLGKMSERQDLVIWDVAAGQVRSRFPVRATSRAYFCFSPDGRFFASACIDSPILTVWECSSGEIYHRLDMKTNDFWGVAFSPDSRLIAACGEAPDQKKSAGEVRIWDIESGTQKSRIVDPSTWGITAIAFSPDGRTLATGDGAGKVKMWDVPAGP